jgi:hypothetical protein
MGNVVLSGPSVVGAYNLALVHIRLAYLWSSLVALLWLVFLALNSLSHTAGR